MTTGTLVFSDPRWADPIHDITEDDAEGAVFDRFRTRLEHGLQFGRAASVFPVPNDEDETISFYLSQEDAENGVGCVAKWVQDDGTCPECDEGTVPCNSCDDGSDDCIACKGRGFLLCECMEQDRPHPADVYYEEWKERQREGY